MNLKKFLVGLGMLVGVVVMFVVMPKQANAAAAEQYATVVNEPSVQLGEYVVKTSENANSPFVNLWVNNGDTMWQAIRKLKRNHHRKH